MKANTFDSGPTSGWSLELLDGVEDGFQCRMAGNLSSESMVEKNPEYIYASRSVAMNGGIEHFDGSDYCANGCGKKSEYFRGGRHGTARLRSQNAILIGARQSTNTPDNLISKIDTPSRINSEEIIAGESLRKYKVLALLAP